MEDLSHVYVASGGVDVEDVNARVVDGYSDTEVVGWSEVVVVAHAGGFRVSQSRLIVEGG